jgi:hypothetical protein
MDIKLTCAAHGLEERMVRCRGFLADSLSDVRLKSQLVMHCIGKNSENFGEIQ